MHQRDPAVVRRDLVGEPGDEALHVFDLFRLAGAVLIGPALVLTGVVTAGLAVVGQARRDDVDHVQFGKAPVHCVIDRPTIFALEFRQRRVPEDAPLDESHEIEGGSDHALVLAQRQRRGAGWPSSALSTRNSPRRAQGDKIGVPVRTNRDRLAIDQSALGGQAADCLSDLRKTCR